MKILLIDDERVILKCLGESLQQFFPEHEIITRNCFSIWEAVNAIQSINPDLLFLDHNLTEENNGEGLEIAKQFASTITIYSISGDLQPEMIEEYKKLGVEYLGKILKPIYFTIKNKKWS